MKFKGDIIITDPCYVIKERKSRPSMSDYPILAGKGSKKFVDFTDEEKTVYDQYSKDWENWEKNNPDDWDRCGCGDNMEVLGFTNYLSESTMYGDWSCHTFNTETGEDLGRFCADAGLVGVFLLDEILAYNPEYNDHLTKTHCATWIKDFDGDVYTEVIEIEPPEDDEEWYDNEELRVIGTGNINFYTTQTGL